MGREHNIGFILLVVGAALAFVVTATFNGAASSFGVTLGIFQNTTGGISDKYYLEITPIGWVFSIWGFIYTWQAIFLVYGLASLGRRGEGGYLYLNPPVVPIYVYGLYIINMALNLGWIFCWDRESMIAGLVVIAFMTFSLHVMLFCCHRTFGDVARNLASQGRCYEIWLVRMLVHNALAFYCGWLSVATLLNVAIVMSYNATVSIEDSSTVALSILLVEIVVYFILESTVLDKFLRYQFSQYIPILAALMGSMVKNWNPAKRNSIFTAVLLGLAIAIFLAKIIIMIVRHKKEPIPSPKVSCANVATGDSPPPPYDGQKNDINVQDVEA